MTEKNEADSSKAPHDHPDYWMLRPCDVYLDEFIECKSWKARYHQRYVHGYEKDCTPWERDHQNCIQFRETKSMAALESLLENEKARREQRLAGARGNDVWEYRSSPPQDWNAPLPEHLQNASMPKIHEQGDKSSCVIS